MKRINTMIRCLVAMPALVVALLTSCTSEEVVNSQPGGNPLELKAEMYSGYATRSTSASTDAWTKGDIVTVSDAGTQCQYKITDATSGTLSAVSTQIYWGTSQTSKALTAWSYGGGAYNAALPTSWGVSTDQSTAGNLQANDFLYASVTAMPNTTTSLPFAHKLAKILIKMTSSNTTLTSSNTTFSDVVVKAANVSTFDGSSWSAPTGDPVSITPLHDTADGSLATYTALVLPQTMSGKELFRFTATVDGITSTYAYTTPATTIFAPGTQYIFNINFALDNVSVTAVTATDWTTTDGGTITSNVTQVQKISGTWSQDDDGAITVGGDK